MGEEAFSYEPDFLMTIDGIEEIATTSASGDSRDVYEVACEEEFPGVELERETEQLAITNTYIKTCLICSSDSQLDMQCLSRGVPSFL